MAAFALAGATLSLLLSRVITRAVYEDSAVDVWFEADLPRILRTMTTTTADARATHHPVFAIVVWLPTQLLMALGLSGEWSARAVVAGFSAVWPVLLFRLLRATGSGLADAVIFTLIGLSSASALFFLGVPETFLVGSLTIMGGLQWAARDGEGRASAALETLVSAATLSISITNWMVGLLSTFVRRRAGSALLISAAAFALVSGVWVVQSRVFQTSRFFVGASYLTMEREHLFSPEAIGPLPVLRGFFAHPMVMPAIQLVDRPSSARWPLLLTQSSLPGSAGVPGVVALVSWMILFGAGVAGLTASRDRRWVRLLVPAALAGQCVLHLVFGNETFLYSLHWVPLLVVFASFSTGVGRWRLWIRTACVMFLASATFNNVTQLNRATAFVRAYEPSVRLVEQAERREIRTSDPWPQQPTVISTPWDRDDYDLAAYEPGGSFWPSMDTFNVAFWITDASGRIVETSHVGAGERVASTVEHDAEGRPRIETITPSYRLVWQCLARRRWTLTIEVLPSARGDVFVMVRGVGWRFSRIRSIERDERGVRVNRRWRIESDRAWRDVRLGVEDADSPFVEQVNSSRGAEQAAVSSDVGWGFARLGALPIGTTTINLFDEQADGSVDTVVRTLDGQGDAAAPKSR